MRSPLRWRCANCGIETERVVEWRGKYYCSQSCARRKYEEAIRKSQETFRKVAGAVS